MSNEQSQQQRYTGIILAAPGFCFAAGLLVGLFLNTGISSVNHQVGGQGLPFQHVSPPSQLPDEMVELLSKELQELAKSREEAQALLSSLHERTDALRPNSPSGIQPPSVVHNTGGGDISGDEDFLANADVEPIPRIGFDVDGRRMTASEMREQVAVSMQRIPNNLTVYYPAENERHVITVFDDPTCPYCRKFHAAIPELNAAGVTVRALMVQRHHVADQEYSGIESIMRNMKNAWCSPNKEEAFNRIMETAGRGKLPEADCDSLPAELERQPVPLAFHLGLAKAFGVGTEWGTPTIITNDGKIIEGFLNADHLLMQIEG